MTHRKTAILAAILIVLPIGFAGGDVTFSCADRADECLPASSVPSSYQGCDYPGQGPRQPVRPSPVHTDPDAPTS
ncbi:MAG: hypothetical protein ACLFV7_03975 [Phycisphaerae bacterium]